MRKFFYCILFVFLPSSYGWSAEPILYDDLILRKGVYYRVNQDAPYNGRVTGSKNGRIIDGKIDGLWISYSTNGFLDYKAYFKGGQLDGRWEKFHRSGRLAEEGGY